MNGGPLPPVPDLIPISVLHKSSPTISKVRHCSPYSTYKEVMGEQRSRRTGKQPAIDLIDTAQSRGLNAAPQAPSRKARSERHRKSDRRRVRKGSRRRSNSKQRSRSRVTSPERPVNPRVNPIFVWVRQVDTRIVDVKCEDYDKRNRILLTKTAQGWRAIPRTETLVPSFREAADQGHHRARKSRKSGKVKRKSTAVQVDEDMQESRDAEDVSGDSPTWTAPVNIESHLPSHTIHIPKNRSESPEQRLGSSVNSELSHSAQTQSVKCSASKLCDVSPLDNLLAVAELEFNHQIQTGEWNKSSAELTEVNDSPHECILKSLNEESKEYIANLNKLIDSCSSEHEESRTEHTDFGEQKIEDCDYTEDDENNLAMDDILSRLEQSLRSPENCPEVVEECNSSVEEKSHQEEEDKSELTEISTKDNYESVPETPVYYDQKDDPQEEKLESDYEGLIRNETHDIVESSTTCDINEDCPTDLSLSRNTIETFNDMIPTDLSIPKNKVGIPLTPRPSSQNSETIQSPQPSGIPAVPPSPDIFLNNKPKFMDLPGTIPKVSSHSETGIPLDLGKSRKSASPTVTCSEEVKINSYLKDLEPLAKKFKSDVTLKTLLDANLVNADVEEPKSVPVQQSATPQTPRLLELLTSESEIDPLTQLKQVLSDTTLNVPDPMLVPKDRLSHLLSAPSKEIPRLLKQRPELRLPEALAFPHLLQDPDILVITLSQLETIIQKQCQPLPLKDIKESEDKVTEKSNENKNTLSECRKENKSNCAVKRAEEEFARHSAQRKEEQQRGGINELANDIDAATNAAFNQMMWLPYLNQLEAAAMSFGGNPDFLKMLSTVMPMYPTPQIPDLSHMMNSGRIPPPVNFPMQPPMNYGSLDCSMWQEAMLQANMLRPRNPFDAFNAKQNFRDYSEQMNVSNTKKPHGHQKMPSSMNKTNSLHHPFYMPNVHQQQSLHNPFQGMSNTCQQSNSIQIPQYNALHHQKNSFQSRKSNNNQPFLQKNQYSKYDSTQQSSRISNSYQQPNYRQQNQPQSNMNNQRLDNQKGKLLCKSFANVAYQNQKTPQKHHGTPKKPEETTKSSTHQPMDLSGSTTTGGKLKVKQHLVDQTNAPKLLKYDENPEVGSTTASIEEMQDAQKHLWHPLFGNQKGYTSPWNWTTVTATGE